jgi:DNA-binding transcriptional MocR family regulator
MPARRANRMRLVKPNAIGALLKQGADPALISFAGGYPDAASFPTAELSDIYQSVIRDQDRNALQYTVADGPEKFRAQIAQRMRARGMCCEACDVLVLNGSQQGLDLTAKLLINPGDVIVTESPTFLGAMVAFNPCEPVYAGVRMDAQGMDMDDLQRVLETTPNVRLIYTIPDFQNPTGVTLSADRRKRLIELANQFDVMVLEDTAYRDLRFTGDALPTIKSLDTQDRVIMLGSFSKILAPGLRLGWAVGSPDVIHDLGLLKLAADTQSGTVSMAAASLYLERYDMDAHIAVLRDVYRRKKDLMLDTIRRQFPQEVSFTDPDGGLFTWLTFPDGFDTEAFMTNHGLPQAKVAYVPGATFFPVEQQTNHARFNYSRQSDDRIVAGLTALGAVLKSAMARS